MVWAETMSSEEELRSAATAAARVGAPFCATLSFETARAHMMGVTSTGFAGLIGSLDTQPVAFGANCGNGAPDLLRTILGISSIAPDAAIIAKANAGIPSLRTVR